MVNHKPKDDWNRDFEKWNFNRKTLAEAEILKKVNPPVKQVLKPVKTENPKKSLKKYYQTIFFLVLLVLALTSIYLLLSHPVSNNSFIIIVVSISLLAFLFFSLLFFHRVYEKSIYRFKPTLVLAFSYVLIIANMLLGFRIYSLEWAFLGFLIIAIIFYDFKIDSRFLILPALLLLGYIPFLLIGAQKEIAETIAVFVYYFLVVGVGLQISEYYKKTENSLDFSYFIENFMNKEKIISFIPVWGVVTLAIIVFNRFKSLELLKWSAVYIFAVFIVLYIISSIQEQKQ